MYFVCFLSSWLTEDSVYRSKISNVWVKSDWRSMQQLEKPVEEGEGFQIILQMFVVSLWSCWIWKQNVSPPAVSGGLSAAPLLCLVLYIFFFLYWEKKKPHYITNHRCQWTPLQTFPLRPDVDSFLLLLQLQVDSINVRGICVASRAGQSIRSIDACSELNCSVVQQFWQLCLKGFF